MNQDHPDFRTVKKIVLIARRHFQCRKKNTMPALKAKNPHYGKWENPHSTYKIIVKFDDEHAQIIFYTDMRSHIFLTNLHALEDRLIEKIKVTQSIFALHTLLIGFREKIKHLLPTPVPPHGFL
ncbi:hypothetical protein UFOVP736_54 [uncultured Caudovirales phage]|uniref:Uncharacterized protein n=1 Tax=uncultured Caudovirales phage TaxID=2100421 RepID=A0A6J5NUE0_9CAUD|nr:hypothetical protein UFOVP705_27 [uncultured Caudovirales phage]CAB5224317.1 hypothetical protein UFOVP736_54 [uncultured Caudovirales phage]